MFLPTNCLSVLDHFVELALKGFIKHFFGTNTVSANALEMFQKCLQKCSQKDNIQLKTFQSSVVFHIETSHLICPANQITGFYMEYNGLMWVTWINLPLTHSFLDPHKLFLLKICSSSFAVPLKRIYEDLYAMYNFLIVEKKQFVSMKTCQRDIDGYGLMKFNIFSLTLS